MLEGSHQHQVCTNEAPRLRNTYDTNTARSRRRPRTCVRVYATVTYSLVCASLGFVSVAYYATLSLGVGVELVPERPLASYILMRHVSFTVLFTVNYCNFVLLRFGSP